MAADLSKRSYFSLPGEVRNKIMDYVLVPGDIYPCRPVLETPTNFPDTTVKIESHPGIQLLATCKQAHDEGHTLFYSSNTFHLPPTMTFEWPDGLQAKHRAMIKRISITIGLEELTPAMLNQIESSMPAGVGQKNGGRWGDAVLEVVEEDLESKLSYIAAWSSLEEVELCSFGRTDVLQHDLIVANLGQFLMWYRHPYWGKIFVRWHKIIFGNIMVKVNMAGWKETKEWLRVRKPGDLIGDFPLGRLSQEAFGI